MISPRDKVYFCQLILKYKDQTITPEEMGQLDQLLLDNPEYVEEVAQITEVLIQLQKLEGKLPCVVRDEILSDALWQALAADEKQAPVIEVPKEIPQGSIRDIEAYRPAVSGKKLSRRSIFSIIASAAAVIFFVLFARFVPPKGGYAVSTLTDSVGAKWAEKDAVIPVGQRLTAGSRFLLQEGLVELLFDSEAKVTIEAPADFTVLGSDQIKLNYGRLFADVPRAAIGFSVTTPNSKVIDLGTQFGVLRGIDGITEAHVFQGQIALFAGQKNQQFSVLVNEGYAKRVDEKDNVSVVDLKNEYFVRKIDSSNDFVWRGEDISLADIVGGGNGFGTGGIDRGINPISGRPAQLMVETQAANNDFRPVGFTPYVDGVFVPDGRTRQIISSQGHVFQECPATSGTCFNNVLNAVRLLDSDAAGAGSIHAARCVLLHANMGITYDLQAMRTLLPEAKIVRFQSRFGIEKEAVYPDLSNADFWVLVDGQLRFQRTQVRCGELFEVSLALSDKDRFLTLVVTEGQDPPQRYVDGLIVSEIHSDWGIFVDPVLILESK